MTQARSSICRRAGSTPDHGHSSSSGYPKAFSLVPTCANGVASFCLSPTAATRSSSSSNAAVDQGPRSKHFADLQRLEPTADELRAAAAWARTHDPSEGFHQELRGALRDLGVRDGDV